MVTCIKTNNSRNFLFDKKTGEKVNKLDENNKNICLSVKMGNNSVLTIDNSQLKRKHGGDIYFEYKDNMYIVDDGYQNLMIQAGYIVADDFDKRYETDKEKGTVTRQTIIESIRKSCNVYAQEHDNVEIISPNNSTKMFITTDDFKYTLVFDPASKLVNKNMDRGINNLPYYPFDKNMDKFGTIYVSCFAERLKEDIDNTRKFNEIKNVVFKIINNINNLEDGHVYHYVSMECTKRIIYSEVL